MGQNVKKLSEQFLEMSQRAAALENKTDAVRQENHKAFESHVAEARAALRSAQAAFAARLDMEDEALAAPWRELDEGLTAYFARVQHNMDESANARDLASARARANDAEVHAEIAAEFARLTAAEAATAMVEARQARANAQSVEKARS